MGQVHSLAVARDFLRVSSVAREEVSDDDLMRYTILNRTVVSARGCWEWQGANTRGYGTIMRGRKLIRVHRLSYELWCGAIPEGMVMRHKCDNPCCVNPNHLVSGTQAENLQDIRDRGRFARTKLTAGQVSEIRGSKESTEKLADKFSVGVLAIRRARKGITWQHVPASPAMGA